MGLLHKQNHSFVILLLLGFLAVSYACDCSDPPKPSPPPPTPCPPPPFTPPPPTVKPPPPYVKPTPPPPPPYVKPSPPPPPPYVKPTPPPPPPYVKPTPPPPPPYVKPTPPPPPPYVKPTPPPPPPMKKPPPPPPMTKPPPPPPMTKPPPPPTPCPPPPPPSKPTPKPKTCPINTVKLGACVDVLGGLLHIGLGKDYAKAACCPILDGLVDLDAAVCLCTSIRAKLLNIDLLIPIALELLIDCGKTPSRDFKCPAPVAKTPLSH